MKLASMAKTLPILLKRQISNAMAIFGLLLKSIFLVALMAAVLIIGVIIYLYMRVKRMARTFAAGQQAAGTTKQRPGSRSNASRQSATTNSGSGSTAFSDEELYDERSTHEINRKIFSKDEGEYIDYEEVK